MILVLVTEHAVLPFFFDSLKRMDGLKLASLLGSEFEDQETSPYYIPIAKLNNS